jgi:hypothetical protein
MKFVFTFAGIGIVFLGLFMEVRAQTTAVEIQQPKVVTIDFAEQPESPLKMAVGKSPYTIPTIVLSNTDSRPIRGYVLLVDTDGLKTSSINLRLERMIDKEKPYLHLVQGRVPENRVTVSVDYVQFIDGGSWGADEVGGSKIITTYLEGRDIAIKRLEAMLTEANLDSTEFLGPIRAVSGFGLGGPVTMKHDAAHFRREGYRTVIKSLRIMSKRTVEAQELARKLELGENSIEQ